MTQAFALAAPVSGLLSDGPPDKCPRSGVIAGSMTLDCSIFWSQKPDTCGMSAMSLKGTHRMPRMNDNLANTKQTHERSCSPRCRRSSGAQGPPGAAPDAEGTPFSRGRRPDLREFLRSEQPAFRSAGNLCGPTSCHPIAIPPRQSALRQNRQRESIRGRCACGRDKRALPAAVPCRL